MTESVTILSWNVAALAPTLKNIDLKYGSLERFLTDQKLDILCLQETKLNEAQLTKDVVCIGDYQSFWAISREKKGYSGVVTYASPRWAPVDAWIDCLGSGDSDIDREGRVVITDHVAFVLFNVYVPNAGERPARSRLGFKLDFLRALKRKADEFQSRGCQVLLVGDFNVAVQARDVHSSMRFDELYAAEELEAMRQLSASGPYVDLWRWLHPTVFDSFTCWDERSSARAFNRGLRIDYVIATRGLLGGADAATCEVVPVDVLPPKWSDHAGLRLELQGLQPPVPGTAPCPAWLTRREKVVDSRQRSILDMFGRAKKKPRLAEQSLSEQAASRATGQALAKNDAAGGKTSDATVDGGSGGTGQSPKQPTHRPAEARGASNAPPAKGSISAFFSKQASS